MGRVMKITNRRGFLGIVKILAASALALLVASCGGGMDFGSVFDSSDPNAPVSANQPPPGNVTQAKVALLLPLSARGQTAQIALSMKQAAELALLETGSSSITLVTKDTKGTPGGSAAAASAALDEGAEIILGPLLGNDVRSVTPIARARNVPIIAFSSVSAVASPGTYLMSFLPSQEVSNLIRHAASAGMKNMAAMIPQSQYGSIVERAFKASAARHGVSVATIERYSRNGNNLPAAARRLTARVNSPSAPVQAVFIPEGGRMLRAISTALARSGFSPRSVKVLGTGLWDSPQTASIPVASGGWYAGVSPQKVAAFEQRFQASYRVKPSRLASLSYDAVSLVAAFAKHPRGTRFTASQITNPEGFNGVNGLFRFRPDGRIERGLSILEVSATGTRVVAPAPTRFNYGY